MGLAAFTITAQTPADAGEKVRALARELAKSRNNTDLAAAVVLFALYGAILSGEDSLKRLLTAVTQFSEGELKREKG